MRKLYSSLVVVPYQRFKNGQGTNANNTIYLSSWDLVLIASITILGGNFLNASRGRGKRRMWPCRNNSVREWHVRPNSFHAPSA
ncbi:hypothetical protein BJX76DRAFT_327017 [Aspergillus varians]